MVASLNSNLWYLSLRPWFLAEMGEFPILGQGRVVASKLSVRCLGIQEELKTRTAGPLCRAEPTEVIQASGYDASLTSPWAGILGMPMWKETSVQTQNTLRDYISWLAW